MKVQKNVQCEIYRQKAQPLTMQAVLNGGETSADGVTLALSETDGACRTGHMRLTIQNDELAPWTVRAPCRSALKTPFPLPKRHRACTPVSKAAPP